MTDEAPITDPSQLAVLCRLYSTELYRSILLEEAIDRKDNARKDYNIMFNRTIANILCDAGNMIDTLTRCGRLSRSVLLDNEENQHEKEEIQEG